jgi:hypothetical protein
MASGKLVTDFCPRYAPKSGWNVPDKSQQNRFTFERWSLMAPTLDLTIGLIMALEKCKHPWLLLDLGEVGDGSRVDSRLAPVLWTSGRQIPRTTWMKQTGEKTEKEEAGGDQRRWSTGRAKLLYPYCDIETGKTSARRLYYKHTPLVHRNSCTTTPIYSWSKPDGTFPTPISFANTPFSHSARPRSRSAIFLLESSCNNSGYFLHRHPTRSHRPTRRFHVPWRSRVR